ncbi:MAG: 50S ribosomal protein L23 [Gammaproteobacteria bacterium]|jgi:large subunit ribosomal protein L23|nr:50S ribosomal protein L23 [Gammaproteobacteria bacterium]|tara:strand:+ start:609 stop:917 length:309 start_codon:yes stop_codon:yes gene_type:complete
MTRAAHEKRLMTIILGPHVSEKSTAVADQNNQVVFKVRPDATKVEIRKAVELLFEVKVGNVTVVNVSGKVRLRGANRGRKSDWKKAYVKLAPGQNLDFMGVE